MCFFLAATDSSWLPNIFTRLVFQFVRRVKTPTPEISALIRTWPISLGSTPSPPRTQDGLSKGNVVVKSTRRGLVVKRTRVYWSLAQRVIVSVLAKHFLHHFPSRKKVKHNAKVPKKSEAMPRKFHYQKSSKGKVQNRKKNVQQKLPRRSQVKFPQRQKIAQTAPKNILNNSWALPNKTRGFRQIAPESSPESSAISLSHKLFGVPFLSTDSSSCEVAASSLPQCLHSQRSSNSNSAVEILFAACTRVSDGVIIRHI